MRTDLIKDAGVAFYSPQKKGNLGEVLLHVLEDEHYRDSLAQRSWIAQAKVLFLERDRRALRGIFGKVRPAFRDQFHWTKVRR